MSTPDSASTDILHPPIPKQLTTVVEELTNMYNENLQLKSKLEAYERQLASKQRASKQLRQEISVLKKKDIGFTAENARLYAIISDRHGQQVRDTEEIRDLRLDLEHEKEDAAEVHMTLNEVRENLENTEDLMEVVAKEKEHLEWQKGDLEWQKGDLEYAFQNVMRAANSVLAHPTIQAMSVQSCGELGAELAELRKVVGEEEVAAGGLEHDTDDIKMGS
ncbi:hypothetical protein LTR36_003499 [Oleoguttula mirabilis]|uniref:Uncharacterized protein n=1 Tax=Oleoguttula mirabilis TaxID=1507867 RepID=A0AAV9JJK6_9PEZI|nr:hypothetical protein LTR36_003499 [Oleoguttula mirabilis]